MYLFLIPLLSGFALDWASTFTTFYSRRWGARRGQLVGALLRNLLGIPLWVVGLVMSIRTASPLVFNPGPFSRAAAWFCLALGAGIILLALSRLGRAAAASAVGDSLVETGLYAYVRHPLYSGVLLEFVGTALLQPHRTVLLACLLGLGWLYVQARLEEIDLLQRIPAYRGYMRRVPRFFPRLNRGS